MRAYAQLTGSFVVFVNRVGVDESMTFWGGSEVIGPSGEAVFSAPVFHDGLYLVDVNLDQVRPEPIALPLLRRARLEPHAPHPRPTNRRPARTAPRPTDATGPG